VTIYEAMKLYETCHVGGEDRCKNRCCPLAKKRKGEAEAACGQLSNVLLLLAVTPMGKG